MSALEASAPSHLLFAGRCAGEVVDVVRLVRAQQRSAGSSLGSAQPIVSEHIAGNQRLQAAREVVVVTSLFNAHLIHNSQGTQTSGSVNGEARSTVGTVVRFFLK